MRRLLVVTAHPDDEAANFGGTVALYANQNVHCRLVCLTAGEAARNRGPARSNPELQALRRQELAASCRLLGFHQHEAWDLPDAHLPEAPFYPTVGRLVAVLRDYRPDVVLTMGPEGSVTAHPDHAMAGILATAAFHWAAHERYFPELDLHPFQAARLLYATAPLQPPQFPPVWLPHPDLAMDVAPYLERKIAAFRCHLTQAPLFDRVEAFLRPFGALELFHLAAGAPLPEPLPATDLFAQLPA
ncbi:MAG TPA: PIG-L family deacetylase [Terriglobales bacterium]|nr:PIG-L family deacetylase [Terriglobales bacterium]